jgi:hypothetical protein
MKLSEKTLELTICSQVFSFPCCVECWEWKRKLEFQRRCPIWFGLTQKQEARAGFDAAIRLKARILFLQFKASNKIVGNARRFSASHNQMASLMQRVRAHRSIYYCLPDVGNTAELSTRRCVACRTYLLDVASIPKSIEAPSRKSGNHFLDLVAKSKSLTIRSDPVECKVQTFDDLFSSSEEVGTVIQESEKESFIELASFFDVNTVGLLLPAAVTRN